MVIAAQYPVMKILAISDQEVEEIYDLVPQGHFSGIEMVISCGDLRYEYLEYLVTLLNVDLFYVPGNHDPADDPESPATRAAGCTNLDMGTARAKGLLLAGFGGSIRYRPDGTNQYTQAGAFLRAAMLVPRLWRNRLRYGRALDVLITHSPPYGVHDDDSRAHRGLKAINWLLDWSKARYHLHGHIHFVQSNISRDVLWQGTTSVLNVYPYRLIEIENG
jgi:Icc-related predicted phosphoesterase